MWHLTKLALNKRRFTILIAAMLTAASVWATFQLKMEFIPDIEFPLTTVMTYYPDASSDEVVNDVTEPIEAYIWEQWGESNLRHLYSTSTDQVSVIVADFEYGTDMEGINNSIEQGVNGLDLPPEVDEVPQMGIGMAENPRIIPLNVSQMPLVILTLIGDLPTDELEHIACTKIVPSLEDIEGVLDVEVEGGDEEQVIVAPDPQKMSQYDVSIYQIGAVLSFASGISSLGDIEDIAIKGDSVALGQIAEVSAGPAPRSTISRTNGKNSVAIMVMKEVDANTVDVANIVADKAEEINSRLNIDSENKVELKPLFDQSDFIERSIWQLTQMALIGFALAVIVVFLFLTVFRASLITALSIPFSVVIGFLVMHLYGITINMLTLSAMAIAVGRLIDNSIVIVEVIYRRLQQGEGFRDAAINGSREVAAPVTSSTLATVAIFIPMVFVGGIVGELFIPFALTITFALIASLLIALMVVPAFSNFFTGAKVNKQDNGACGEAWYQRIYVRILKWALAHRVITIVVVGVLFFGSLGLVPVIGTSFIPSTGVKLMIIEIELPPGADIKTTSDLAMEVENLLSSNNDVESFHTTIGTSTTMFGVMSAIEGGGDNTAEIMVVLHPDVDLDGERDELELAVRDIADEDVITVLIGGPITSHLGSSILELSIQGETYEALEGATDALFDKLADVKGIINLKSQTTKVVPRLFIDKSESKIIELELPLEQSERLDREFRLLRMGSQLPNVSVNLNGETHEIFLKGVANELYETGNPELSTRALRVGWPETLALDSVADVALVECPTHISHTNRKLSASISGIIEEKNVGAVNRAVQKEVDAILDGPYGEGIEVKVGGIFEEMSEAFSSMSIAIIAAIIIAYLILVITMRSLLNPLIIMISLPLASIGALIALLVSGHTMGVSAMMGILMLVGIVLTNAIVLISLVEQLRKQGMSTENALIDGGRIRIRPILMTALTTMVAMVPLAFGIGEGTIIAAELAVVVIGGLFSSTVLTLVVIPVIYSTIDNLRQRRQSAS